MADKKYYVVEWEDDGVFHGAANWYTASEFASKNKIKAALETDMVESLYGIGTYPGYKRSHNVSNLARLQDELKLLEEQEDTTTLKSREITIRQVVVSTPTSVVKKVEEVFAEIKDSFFKEAKKDVQKAIDISESIEVAHSSTTALEDIPTDQLIEELYRRKGDK